MAIFQHGFRLARRKANSQSEAILENDHECSSFQRFQWWWSSDLNLSVSMIDVQLWYMYALN